MKWRKAGRVRGGRKGRQGGEGRKPGGARAQGIASGYPGWGTFSSIRCNTIRTNTKRSAILFETIANYFPMLSVSFCF